MKNISFDEIIDTNTTLGSRVTRSITVLLCLRLPPIPSSMDILQPLLIAYTVREHLRIPKTITCHHVVILHYYNTSTRLTVYLADIVLFYRRPISFFKTIPTL